MQLYCFCDNVYSDDKIFSAIWKIMSINVWIDSVLFVLAENGTVGKCLIILNTGLGFLYFIMPTVL